LSAQRYDNTEANRVVVSGEYFIIHKNTLAPEDIEHTKTKAKSPQTNGICERFHRTMQDEFYATAFRKKIYQTIDDLQADIDVWLKYYKDPIRVSINYGKTPMQTW
jgi:transposase InsO family protein